MTPQLDLPPGLPVAALELPATPASARLARLYLRDCAATLAASSRLPRSVPAEPVPVVGEDVLDSVLDTATLLVSELVTNAVLHARTPLTLGLSLRGGPLRLLAWVEDSCLLLPQRRSYSPTSGTGRGIALVADLADSWGVDEVRCGKRVWFTLELHSRERSVEFDLDAVEAL